MEDQPTVTVKLTLTLAELDALLDAADMVIKEADEITTALATGRGVLMDAMRRANIAEKHANGEVERLTIVTAIVVNAEGENDCWSTETDDDIDDAIEEVKAEALNRLVGNGVDTTLIRTIVHVDHIPVPTQRHTLIETTHGEQEAEEPPVSETIHT